MGTFALSHLTSRLSASSWPPKLPRSAFDARWPPLETWHLEYIRIASSGGICPLTCAKVGQRGGGCVSAINAAIAGTVAAAEYTTALTIAPSRRLPTLTLAAPSRDPKMSSHHHLLSPPNTLYDRNHAVTPPPPYLSPVGQQLASEAAT
jgi:hypothetical protein